MIQIKGPKFVFFFFWCSNVSVVFPCRPHFAKKLKEFKQFEFLIKVAWKKKSHIIQNEKNCSQLNQKVIKKNDYQPTSAFVQEILALKMN